MSIFLVILFFSLGGYRLGLSLPPLNPSFNLTAPDEAIALNASRLEDYVQPHCSSNFYGYGLDRESCFEALRNLNAEHKFHDSVYTQRGTGTEGDYQLPNRHLSSDGNCAIDILLQPGVKVDTATAWELSTPARDIIIECDGSGGEISGIGKDNKLTVRVSRYYNAPTVICGNTVPGTLNTRECQPVLESMPASGRTIQVFGPSGDPRVNVAIPKTFSTAGFYSSCRVGISTISAAFVRDQSTDWNVWAAAVAVDAMCWRRGYSGFAHGIGVKRNLKVSISHALQLEGNSTGSWLGRDGATLAANK